MQMQSVETRAETAICFAPSRIACLTSLSCFFEDAIYVLDFNGCIVDKDADRKRQTA